MDNTLIFHDSGKLDLADHMVSEDYLSAYLEEAREEKEVKLTEDVFAMMVGTDTTEKKKTVLFFTDGRIKKTILTPFQLHKGFGIERGVPNPYILRQALNFHLDKHPKYAAFVTPHTTFSRFNTTVWANLTLAIKFHGGDQQEDGIKRSLIDFAFGGTLEIHIGIQSVRQTFLVDVLEAWTIQQNHLLGAQPLKLSAGVTNPNNPYMTNKIANRNKVIEQKNRKRPLKRDHQKKSHVALICPKEFVESLHIFAKLLPLIKEGYLLTADIDSFPSLQRELIKKILNWKEGDNNGHTS